MPSQIDHIVIGVRDLADASANYARAGFTVTPGGEHVGGRTHNALVSFGDSSYFEIIAFVHPDEAPAEPHRWWEKIAIGDGLVDFAVLSAGVATEAGELTARGLAIEGPFDGGRVRPDGQRVAWRTLRAESSSVPLPFIIDDQTPRSLRVPDGPAEIHPAGFTAVAGLAIAVSDLEAAKAAYAQLIGSDGAATTTEIPGAASAWRFNLGPHAIDLIQPTDGESELAAHLAARGDGPFEITLRAPRGAGSYLPAETTNSVRIRVIE